MRTKEEILQEDDIKQMQPYDIELGTLEVLIDIRDILANKNTDE